MLVIYEKATGKIERISLSTVKEPTREEVASDLDPLVYDSFTAENDQAKIINQQRYIVKFDDEDKPSIEYQPKKLIELQCDSPDKLEDGRYQLAADALSTTEVRIGFVNENGQEVFPTGTLEISPSRGSVSKRFIKLDGSVSSVPVTFTSIAETVPVEISARIAESVDYEKGLLRIELVPVSK